MTTRRIFILANDDLTSSIIFSRLFEAPGIEICGVAIAASPIRNASSNFGAALALLKRMDIRYWLYLVFVQGFYKLYEARSCLFGSATTISLRALAKKKGVEFSRVRDFNDVAFGKKLTELALDIVVIRIGAILKPHILSASRYGFWCVHSSILPRHRGIAGEFHALRCGDAVVGSTIFQVSEKLDRGPALRRVAFDPSAESLFAIMLRNNSAASATLAEAIVECALPLQAVPPLDTTPTYSSWPQRHEVREFHRRGRCLIKMDEIWRYVFACMGWGTVTLSVAPSEHRPPT